MIRSRVFAMAMERQVNRRRRLREMRWRELCQRRSQEAAQEGATSRKSRDGLRTISEVADELHVKVHVLRFWETRFPLLKPVKRNGAGRCYRLDDVELVRTVRDLLHVHGYTIKGVQKVLRERGVR